LNKPYTHTTLRVLFAGLLLLCSGGIPARANEPAKKEFDVKATFRNICGFCHADYGRKASKGPQLMGSERSDEFLFNRIKKGLPGRMAGFGSAFSDEDIGKMVKFIRSLKPGVEPENP
jgi:mono/diheme cytochrome c family protein